jgi:general secretion pathway protein I
MAMSIAAPASAISRRRLQSGFTLLEVMVAVAVIGIALVPLLRLHLLSLDATLYAQDLTTAVGLAQEIMAEMPAVPEPGDSKGDFETPAYARFRWQASVGEKEEIIIPNLDDPEGAEPPPFEIQRIEVSVFWKDGQRERLYTLESYAVH